MNYKIVLANKYIIKNIIKDLLLRYPVKKGKMCEGKEFLLNHMLFLKNHAKVLFQSSDVVCMLYLKINVIHVNDLSEKAHRTI